MEASGDSETRLVHIIMKFSEIVLGAQPTDSDLSLVTAHNDVLKIMITECDNVFA